MAEFVRQQTRDGDPIECANCSSVAPVAWFRIGPPFGERDPKEEDALCRYCANTTGEGRRNMARMFNQLEQALMENSSRAK